MSPRVIAMESEILRTRTMLEDYYGATRVLQETWYRKFPDDQSFLVNKFARAIAWEDKIVIGAMGSSVTVGDGNCRYDNYTSQLDRLLRPILAAANVGLEIRNTGQGGECGDSHRNQVWCINNLVGDDLDLIHYSWTYFEAGDRKKEQTHEMFYRWSLMQPGAPVPQLLYTGDCTRVTSQDDQLLDSYAKYGANFLCMSRGIKKAGYAGQVWAEVGDTLHTTTRYGEGKDTSHERRESLGVVYRNWHPGPLLFQTTADTLAYSYTEAMLKALQLIKDEPNPKHRWPLERQATIQLPPVLFCESDICGVPSPPHCLTFSVPKFGSSSINWLANESPEWRIHNDPVRVNYPEQDQELPQCRYNHHCAGLVVESDQAQPLSFDIPKLEKGFIAVCCQGKKCGSVLSEADVVYELDGETIKDAPEVMNAGKCLIIQENMENPGEQEHRLTIQFLSDEFAAPITHIIAL